MNNFIFCFMNHALSVNVWINFFRYLVSSAESLVDKKKLFHDIQKLVDASCENDMQISLENVSWEDTPWLITRWQIFSTLVLITHCYGKFNVEKWGNFREKCFNIVKLY